MEVIPLKSPVIKENDDIMLHLNNALKDQDLVLNEGDIVVITSKILSLSQGRTVEIKDPEYKKGELKELIIKESGEAFESKYCWLSMVDGHLIPNAGIDDSNVPEGIVVLWPNNPFGAAKEIQQQLRTQFKLENFGVLINDSACMPLRNGVVSRAIGFFGFEGVEDYRGKSDIFGRPMQFTQKAVADALSTTAGFVMGETDEQIPFVLIRGAKVNFTNEDIDNNLTIPLEDDLFCGIYSDEFQKFVKKK